jgi:hypothetical protein
VQAGGLGQRGAAEVGDFDLVRAIGTGLHQNVCWFQVLVQNPHIVGCADCFCNVGNYCNARGERDFLQTALLLSPFD